MTKTCNDVWPPSSLSLFSAIVSCILFIIISSGNLLIVLAVVIDPIKKLRSPFNYFVVNLAVSDLIVGFVGMPTGIYFHFAEYLVKKTPTITKVFHLSLFISLTSSILCLIALSVDRYVAITYPFTYRKNVSYQRCAAVSLMIWVLSLTVPFIYLKLGYIDYLMMHANSAVVIAIFVLSVTYFRVYHFLKNHATKMKEVIRTTTAEAKALQAKQTLQQKKITKMYLLILLLFLACYVPATVLIYTLQFCASCDCLTIHIMRDVTYILVTCNSSVNPFVYATTYKHYRKAIWALIARNKRQQVSNSTTTTKSTRPIALTPTS